MNGASVSPLSKGAWLVFILGCLAFTYFAYTGAPATGLMAPAAIAWIAALIGLRPLVDEDKRSGLYFAFAVLALMIYFIHETYGYSGRVRNFPLIVGYTGVVLCILDILSLLNRGIGAVITKFFGSHLDTSEIGGRKVARELIACGAMCGCVLGLWLFGFLVFSPIFVIIWMIVGGKTFKHSVYGGFFTLVFIYLMFELAFKYDLYRGIVFIWLFDL